MSDRTPIHPGEILSEEFLVPMGISQSRLARDVNVPPRRINEICLGKRAITPDTALRLARYFGMSAEFWMTLQQRYDLECAKDELEARLKQEVRPLVREIAPQRPERGGSSAGVSATGTQDQGIHFASS